MFHNTTETNFLGSVGTKADLPLTVDDAYNLFGEIPHKGDNVFVEADETHGGSASQYIIDNIDSDDNISFKYQYSIVIPGVTPPDGVTIDTNSSNQLEVKNAGVSTSKIAPSSVNDQVLKTVSGNVVWADGSTDVTVDNTSIDFNASEQLEVKSAGIVAAKIANSAVISDKIADANVTTDKLANNAVVTSKITDKNVTVNKIAPGANDQTLKTISGEATWVSESGGVNVDNNTIDFNLANELEVKDNAISTIKIQDTAVTEAKLNTGSVSTNKIVDGNVTNSKLATNSVGTTNVIDSNITEAKLATNSVSNLKVVDAAITEAKLADNSVTTSKIVDNAVTTTKVLDKNITPAKLSVGAESQILRTKAGEAIWDTEVDISDKADKFTYTPDEGTLTTYNLDDIQTINIEGNGGGVNPNTGIVYTNFAGEEKVINIEGGAGFFNYKGQVATYEKLPDFSTVENGDLYSIANSINFQGTVASMGDLPESPADYDQYFVTAPNEYVYWDTSVGAGGEWITNHCQFESGCNGTGWYAFGVGDSPNWNRLDSDLTIDQVLNNTSPNAISNKAVTIALNGKVDSYSTNRLSEIFNENDGAGIVYYDADGHEVAGLCLNTNAPQLYAHVYDTGGDLIDRVLVEVHSDGLYISKTLTGTSWVRVATMDDISGGLRDYVTATDYVQDIIIRYTDMDTGSFNRYGITTDEFESTDFNTDVANKHINELVNSEELNNTLQYCIDSYFPTPTGE